MRCFCARLIIEVERSEAHWFHIPCIDMLVSRRIATRPHAPCFTLLLTLGRSGVGFVTQRKDSVKGMISRRRKIKKIIITTKKKLVPK
jgi:hypothetical protein